MIIQLREAAFCFGAMCVHPRSSGHSFQTSPLHSRVHQTLTVACWGHVLGPLVSRTRLRGHIACHCPEAGAVCVSCWSQSGRMRRVCRGEGRQVGGRGRRWVAPASSGRTRGDAALHCGVGRIQAHRGAARRPGLHWVCGSCSSVRGWRKPQGPA